MSVVGPRTNLGLNLRRNTAPGLIAFSGRLGRRVSMKTQKLTMWCVGAGLLCITPGLVRSGLAAELEEGFRQPPDAARPWVYWFWMDGNLSREGITADLEAMSKAGIGGMIIMEVDVGVPRGSVNFMSEPWRALFKHAVLEAQRLGLQITLNAGPGWTGSGGPWVKPEQSMQHIVASTTQVTSPAQASISLARPAPREPNPVHVPLPAAVAKARDDFYEDVAVLAFPTPHQQAVIADCDEKALYYRLPYSSHPGVKPFLPAPASFPALPAGTFIARDRIVDLSDRLGPDGRLAWSVPEGEWTIMRFGRTITGANTRPAPVPGIGLECDKFDKAALDAHFDAFVGSLLGELGAERKHDAGSGWTMLHIDSWEMGSQNWTANFRDEFRRRRGYDPLPYLPAITGRVVESLEASERFLWDLRQTGSELIVENHAEHLKALAQRHGFGLSIEPYDLTPCADLDLGGVADVPMCEFWSAGYGFDTTFSCIEATSIAHTCGRPIVAAESFTANDAEAWRLYPGSMKAQADWAFCFGINRLVFHRYAHQPWLDRWPGMTMGPYGVHYERTQTWWGMADAWHTYLARCQYMLRRGVAVADICYLAAEGAPHVFRPPPSALSGTQPLPDRRGYNFDGCSPKTLARMTVRDGRLLLPDGMSYRVLVLPDLEVMTPGVLRRVKELVEAGATGVGPRPVKSPSLSDYPRCDAQVQALGAELWGVTPSLARSVGQGKIIPSRRPERESDSTQDPGRLLRAARWIWRNEGNPALAAPVGSCRFRRSFDLGSRDAVTSARLCMTADNQFEVELNGRAIGSGDNFNLAYVFDIQPLLKAGVNVVTVTARNGSESPNPAGLIGALEIRYDDGHAMVMPTDQSWQSTGVDGKTWAAALELGGWGMGPWGKVGEKAPVYPPLYGEYAQLADLLTGMGVPPDFESDRPLRYIHRQDGEVDIYFVANGSALAVQAHCVFRVVGRVPQIWDPVSGNRYSQTAYEEKQGRTSLTVSLEPHGSAFVVFLPPQRAAESMAAPPAEPAAKAALQTLAGPWEVRFQPGRGAPEKMTFDRLADWSKHPDTGVRHFSGEAVYATTFELSGERLASGRRLELDIGRVEVMARVRLNGRDLGVLWTPPFRVDITDAIRSGDNRLEITVANLWPNRLIGDQSRPAKERVTWTTWNPFRADSVLLESGLLGPVVLRSVN